MLGVMLVISLIGAACVIGYAGRLAATADRLLVLEKLEGDTLRLRQIDFSFTAALQVYTELRSDFLFRFYDERMSQYVATVEDIRSLGLTEVARVRFDAVLKARDDLFAAESKVITRGKSGDFAGAADMLASSEYAELKAEFSKAIDSQTAALRTDVVSFESLRGGLVQLLYAVTGAFLLLMFASGAIAYVIATRVFTTAQGIERAAAAIGRGNLEERVPVTGHDELARAAIAFNKMAVALDGKNARGILERITREIGQ